MKLSLCSACVVVSLFVSFLCRAAETTLPPCDTQDFACLEKQLLNQVYLNEALRQRNTALARGKNIAEEMSTENGRRADKAESALANEPNVGKWFVAGGVLGFGIALILHLKPFGH